MLSDSRSFKVMQQEYSEIISRFPNQRECTLFLSSTCIYGAHIVRLELATHGGWNSGGSRKVIEEASQQLKTGDLATIRQALSLTVRYGSFAG